MIQIGQNGRLNSRPDFLQIRGGSTIFKPMQMRRLHPVLLILMLVSCGPGPKPELSDYIKKNKEFKNKDQLAFLLNTENDTLNQVFGIIAESLVDSELVTPPQSGRGLERLAAMSRGRWLLSHARTAELGGGIAAQFDLDTRFRWGYRGYASALDYGMSSSADSLEQLTQEALTSLSRLHREYVGSSPEILERQLSPDSVSEAATAQLRYAAMMLFGADLCNTRRDNEAEATYRADAGRALKAGRNLFHEARRRYDAAEARKPKHKLDDFLVKPDTTEPDDEWKGFEFDPPDTLAYVQAGVYNGLDLLAKEPRTVVRDLDLLDGLAWLRWNEYRMRDSVKLMETPVLDSVQALLLAGPLPGYLTEQPYRPGAVSPMVMYEFVTNLSELYLGIEPDMQAKKVKINPRLPADWGHTVARVPLKSGYLHVDYDFSKMQAEVWQENISDTLKVEFGFPYKSGGWLNAEFLLTKKNPKKTIRGELAGTRLELTIE